MTELFAVQVECLRDREREIMSIAYKVEGRDPKDLSWDDLTHMRDELVAHFRKLGDLEAASLTMGLSPLPIVCTSDGWVVLYD